MRRGFELIARMERGITYTLDDLTYEELLYTDLVDDAIGQVKAKMNADMQRKMEAAMQTIGR